MVQVFFVMLFFPVIMNALQYYIIDSFIKDQKPADHDPSPSAAGDEDSTDRYGRTSRRRSRGEDHDSTNESTKDGTAVKVPEGKDKPKLRVEPKKLDEYDPDVDGEGSGNSGEPESPSGEGKAKAQQGHVKES